jgi:hypothetical protein
MLAVIEGLTLAACMGRISPEDATELAIRYATARQVGFNNIADVLSSPHEGLSPGDGYQQSHQPPRDSTS